eukprot:Rmarinus@m.20725
MVRRRSFNDHDGNQLHSKSSKKRTIKEFISVDVPEVAFDTNPIDKGLNASPRLISRTPFALNGLILDRDPAENFKDSIGSAYSEEEVAPNQGIIDEPTLLREEENLRGPDGGSDQSPGTLYQYIQGELSIHAQNTGIFDPAFRKRERIYDVLNVPYRLERLLVFGFILCLDSFLFLFTFLPVRIIMAFWSVMMSLFSRRLGGFHAAKLCDILRLFLVLQTCWFLSWIDVSKTYHAIRGQAILKLYVIFNVLEIFDQLFSSFGQDVLDTLVFTATGVCDGTSKRSRLVADYLIASFYVLFHSLVLLSQVITLNVAVNSYNNALLTLLVSNNFVELKGSVFKKFAKANLFQISCSDMVERFQLTVFLFLTFVLNSASHVVDWAAPWNDRLLCELVLVYLCEVLVDWIKHCFVTKFNHIEPTVYTRFSRILCSDVIDWRSSFRGSAIDTSHAVSHRLGFVSLPLACIVLRCVSHEIFPVPWYRLLIWWAALTAVRVFISINIMGHSCHRRESDPPDLWLEIPHSIHRFKMHSGRIPT